VIGILAPTYLYFVFTTSLSDSRQCYLLIWC
jgi:hypothetical protein